ncbi:cytokine receptor common subunit beta [Microcaecilia unicolor]|uniref:Cytokine receptor common subunit beta n=1 Tax=Microcaecilia unicolor TaxID=1415580 RepID=A0A6P7YS25_9AMPH|nr:cytokine receptor common subunit beta [Microcaecilia unicolor]XP_030065984.1 cytokine receptor common subunit beta [Microcaecilia unicolor]
MKMKVTKIMLCKQIIPLVLAVWFAFTVGDIQGTPLLESLQCYNDYNTYVVCTYEESLAAQKLLNMNLVYWTSGLNRRKKETCSMMEPRLNDSDHVEWTCWRHQEDFVIAMHDIYTFLPDRELNTSIQISLSQNIQPLPPLKPRIERLNTSDFLLMWESSYDMNHRYLMTDKMQYEVAYKRIWEPWEMALLLLVSNMSQCIFKNSALIPGNYVARIRAKPIEDSKFMGHWSEWSTEVRWVVQAEDEAKPRNLRCLFNGIDKLACHWEVRKEAIDSVSFMLYYKEGPLEKEKECRPYHKLELPGVPYVFSSCEINITNLSMHSQYVIMVRPALETKNIKPCMNIQPLPPENLTMEKMDPGEYQLSWKSHQLGFIDIPQQYQVQYCKIEGKQKDKNEHSHACRWINITKGPKEVFLNVNSHLDPETQYVAKVRAHTMEDNPNNCYNGPWSKWSEEYQWKTDKGTVAQNWQWQLLLVPIGMTVLIICACFGYRYLKRAKKKWEDKIPDPRKSKLFITSLQKGYLVLPQLLDGSEFSKPGPMKDDLCSCSLVLERKINEDSAMLTKEMKMCQLCHSLDHEQSTIGGTVPTENLDVQSFPPLKLTVQDAVSSKSSVENVISPLAFNGPYLVCSHEHTLNTLLSELTLVKNMEELTQRLTGYIKLPQCLTENLPPPLADSQTGTCPPPSSLGYVVNPPECCMNTTLSMMVRGGQTGEALVDGTLHAQTTSTENLTTQSMEGNFEHLQCSVKNVMTPSPGEKHIFPLLSSESTESHKKVPAQLSSVVHPFSSKNECKEQGFPQAEDVRDCGILVLPKLHESYVETSPSLANLLTISQLGIMSTSQELVASKDLGERKDDNIIMHFPDHTSPVFLQQVGDYCFFPGSKHNEHCLDKGKNIEAPSKQNEASYTPSIQQDASDLIRKSKGSPESSDARVEDIPQTHTIHQLKRLKNDYFMFHPV